MKKIWLRLAKTFDKDAKTEITREERSLMIIISKLLSNTESDPLMTPKLDKLYICSADKNVFVVVDIAAKKASVINHHFGYDIIISDRVMSYIENKFYDEVERRRKEMENTYRGNIHYSLSTVIQNIRENEGSTIK